MSLQAEASRLADRYVEERGRIASRQASATYESAAAVPARVKRAFQAFDADHSGYLDYKELANALRFYGVDEPCDQAPFRGTALVSHLHWDHIQGLPFFVPLFIPNNKIDFYGAFDPIYGKSPYRHRL